MTRPLPFTKADIKRRVKAFEELGYVVTGCGPDGLLTVEKPSTAVPIVPHGLHHDPYIIAASGVRDAEKTRKRRGRSS